jgi:hypothetical protein
MPTDAPPACSCPSDQNKKSSHQAIHTIPSSPSKDKVDLRNIFGRKPQRHMLAAVCPFTSAFKACLFSEMAVRPTSPA